MLQSTSATGRPRTMLVDDHPTFRAGLRILLGTVLDIVGEAALASEALALARDSLPEVALVDILLPGADGIALTTHLRTQQPSCRVIGLSCIDEPIQIAEMFRAGASGYVLKTEPIGAILDAVGCLRTGVRYLPPGVSREHVEALAAAAPVIGRLTRREREVFEYLVDDRSNDEIASALSISIRTVETHRQRIMTKLEVRTLIELVRFATRHGLRRH